MSLPAIVSFNQELKAKTSEARKYPKSPFFDQIQQDELRRKREEHLREYEKKKVREIQQTYGKKVRKNLRDSSVFVTD